MPLSAELHVRALILEALFSKELEEPSFRSSSETANATLSERGWGLRPLMLSFSQVSVPKNKNDDFSKTSRISSTY